MKSFKYLLILAVCASGCIKHVPLQGNYPQGPVIGQTDQKVDVVWQKLINVVSEKGLNVKVVDKNSGFIMSDDLSFQHKLTTESKSGKLVNPEAFLVTSRLNVVKSERFELKKVTGQWSVILSPTANGGTEIKAMMAGMEAKDEMPANQRIAGQSVKKYEVYSLQNFEKWLIASLK